MRVLATVTGNASHVRVLSIVLRPLTDAGHEVVVATTPDLVALVEELGVPVHSVLPSPVLAMQRDGVRETEAPSNYAKQMSLFPGKPLSLLAARALIPLIEEWAPDVIVRDDMEFGSVLAAEHLGIPQLSVPGGVANALDPTVAIDGLNQHWAALGHSTPLPPQAIYRGGRVDFIPRTFEFVVHQTGVVHRYRQPVLTRRGERLPEWIAELPGDKPFVYASLGTALPMFAGKGSGSSPIRLMTDPTEALAAIVAALSHMDCHALISTGGLPLPERSLPEHVHVAEFVAQPLVLEVADLFITHGGLNSVRESMRSATPMLVIPGFGDQVHLAGKLTELGLARATVETTPENVAALAREILAQPAYLRRARQARAHNLALPEIDQFAADLEKVVLSAPWPPITDGGNAN